MKQIWLITMESEHFRWAAVGRTESEARQALRATWEDRVPDRGGYTWAEFTAEKGSDPAEFYGVNCRALALGSGDCE